MTICEINFVIKSIISDPQTLKFPVKLIIDCGWSSYLFDKWCHADCRELSFQQLRLKMGK